MRNKICLIIVFFSLFLGTGCSNHVDFGEQYKKIIYIVNSNDQVFINQHRISDTVQPMFISLYCSGTVAPEENIPVVLKLNPNAINEYNKSSFDESSYYKHLVMLPEEFYEVPSWETVIRQGEVYGKLPIYLKTMNWDPDSVYVLPLSIESVSGDYEINSKLSTIFYQIELTNNYSGEFNGLCMYLRDGKEMFISKDKKLKAIDVNKVRLSIYNLSDENKDLDDHFMILTVLPDMKVKITPWKNAVITDLGNSVYDPVKKTFILHYECLDGSGNTIEIEETLTNIEINLDDTDEQE